VSVLHHCTKACFEKLMTKLQSHLQWVVGIKLLRKPKNFFELDLSSWTLPVTSAMSIA